MYVPLQLVLPYQNINYLLGYAYGVVLWEIFHRKDPYNGKDPLSVAVDVINKSIRPEIDPTIPPEIASLIRSCWATSPEQRPSLESVSNELRRMLSDEDIVPMRSGHRVSAPTGTIFLVATVCPLFSIIMPNAETNG